jgi:SAM-dependent methyltransferase
MIKNSVVVLTATFLLVFFLTAKGQYNGDDEEYEVPFVPTANEIVEQMLRLADVSNQDMLYDLGCGDGRIVITAAKMYGARGVGIDINPIRIEESRENAKKEGVTDKVRFIEQDLFEADIRDGTVITLYLLPGVNLRLRPMLFQRLKPGSRIVSHNYDMGDWKSDQFKIINQMY